VNIYSKVLQLPVLLSGGSSAPDAVERLAWRGFSGYSCAVGDKAIAWVKMQMQWEADFVRECR